MYMGEVSTKQLISVALMILVTMAMIFFIGYKFAYDKAIRYATEQNEEKLKENRKSRGIKGGNPDFILGNTLTLGIGGQDEK